MIWELLGLVGVLSAYIGGLGAGIVYGLRALGFEVTL